jgi:hypothetical protein
MTAVQAIREDTSQRALGQRHSAWPRAVAAATVAWNLWQVRATVAAAHYPNGPGTALRWSLYLLWCLWPAAIYACARVFGLAPPAAACAAVAASLLRGAPGFGYGQHDAYLWAGNGVWTRLAGIYLAGLGAMAVVAAAPRLAAAIKRFFDLEPVRPGQHYPPVRPPGQPAASDPADHGLDRKQTDA